MRYEREPPHGFNPRIVEKVEMNKNSWDDMYELNS
jgi:hypothetical protein